MKDDTTTPKKIIDGWTVDGVATSDHDPDLYRFDAVAESVDGWEAVSERDLLQFHEVGYLAIDNAFAGSQVDSAIRALQLIVDAATPGSKIVQFEAWAAEELHALSGAQKALAIRKFCDFTGEDPGLAAIANDPRLLSLVGRLMGGAPPVIHQEMCLLKPPGGREKPWHQDRAYFNVAFGTPIIGVWIALDPATPNNGCMRIWPRRQPAAPIVHFQRRDWQICDTELAGADRLAVPLQPGGLLLFDSLLPHGTPRNDTDQRRWAMQFHYTPSDAKSIDDEARMELFGSEGKNVEC